jgi:hypothetical protein
VNEPAVPPPTLGSAPALSTRRCVRHSAREAAARCPSCRVFFCRECVVEHKGRVLCADCLTKANRVAEAPRRRWREVRRASGMLTAAVVAWLSFYGLGLLLLKIPPSLHEDTRSVESLEPQP